MFLSMSWKLNRAFKGVYMMYALFFVKSLNGLNRVLTPLRRLKPVFTRVCEYGLKVLTKSEDIYIQ